MTFNNGGHISKWVLLNCASTSTQPHPPPPSSFQPPSSSFQLPPSSLQHPQRYKNQNIARNWAISPNLGWKIQSCLFCLKTGTCNILKVLIPNPGIDFQNSDCKIHFWANLGQQSRICLFWLKIGTHGILEELILHPDLDFWKFWPQNPFLGKFGPKKSKLSVLFENWHTEYFKDADSYSEISFLKFQA